MIELNKTYTFECPASFGTLSQERVDKLFTDGRRASGFLELQLEEWFEGLVFEDGKEPKFTFSKYLENSKIKPFKELSAAEKNLLKTVRQFKGVNPSDYLKTVDGMVIKNQLDELDMPEDLRQKFDGFMEAYERHLTDKVKGHDASRNQPCKVVGGECTPDPESVKAGWVNPTDFETTKSDLK